MLVALAASCTPAPAPPTIGPSQHDTPASAPSSSASPSTPASAATSPRATPSSGPSAAPAPPAPAPPSKPEIAAWTDSGAVAQLAKDCRWAPAADQEGAGALSCTIEVDQTCNPNECDDVEDRCRAQCTATCEGCADGCEKSCDGCKKTCQDDACRRSCAARCGDCRQACVTNKDHCATGVCSADAVACSEKLRADYEKSGCPALVPRFQRCVETCSEDRNKRSKEGASFMELRECQDGCIRRVMPRCDRFFSYFRIY